MNLLFRLIAKMQWWSDYVKNAWIKHKMNEENLPDLYKPHELEKEKSVPACVTPQEIAEHKEFQKKHERFVIESKLIWFKVEDGLPKFSIAEVIVSDGETTGVAAYDVHTKSFVKTFGAQCMRVPDPKYYAIMPRFPKELAEKNYLEVKEMKGLKIGRGFGLTYNR